MSLLELCESQASGWRWLFLAQEKRCQPIGWITNSSYTWIGGEWESTGKYYPFHPMRIRNYHNWPSKAAGAWDNESDSKAGHFFHSPPLYWKEWKCLQTMKAKRCFTTSLFIGKSPQHAATAAPESHAIKSSNKVAAEKEGEVTIKSATIKFNKTKPPLQQSLLKLHNTMQNLHSQYVLYMQLQLVSEVLWTCKEVSFFAGSYPVQLQGTRQAAAVFVIRGLQLREGMS